MRDPSHIEDFFIIIIIIIIIILFFFFFFFFFLGFQFFDWFTKIPHSYPLHYERSTLILKFASSWILDLWIGLHRFSIQICYIIGDPSHHQDFFFFFLGLQNLHCFKTIFHPDVIILGFKAFSIQYSIKIDPSRVRAY